MRLASTCCPRASLERNVARRVDGPRACGCVVEMPSEVLGVVISIDYVFGLVLVVDRSNPDGAPP